MYNESTQKKGAKMTHLMFLFKPDSLCTFENKNTRTRAWEYFPILK